MTSQLPFTGGIETFFTVPQQVFLFLLSVVMGVALGAVYDVFRVLRIVFPFLKRPLPTAVADILYMLIFGAAVFLLAAYMGRGQVRLFYCIGGILGAVLYSASAGSAVVELLRCCCENIRGRAKKISAKKRS